jgi:hypothetical protein
MKGCRIEPLHRGSPPVTRQSEQYHTFSIFSTWILAPKGSLGIDNLYIATDVCWATTRIKRPVSAVHVCRICSFKWQGVSLPFDGVSAQLDFISISVKWRPCKALRLKLFWSVIVILWNKLSNCLRNMMLRSAGHRTVKEMATWQYRREWPDRRYCWRHWRQTNTGRWRVFNLLVVFYRRPRTIKPLPMWQLEAHKPPKRRGS